MKLNKFTIKKMSLAEFEAIKAGSNHSQSFGLSTHSNGRYFYSAVIDADTSA